MFTRKPLDSSCRSIVAQEPSISLMSLFIDRYSDPFSGECASSADRDTCQFCVIESIGDMCPLPLTKFHVQNFSESRASNRQTWVAGHLSEGLKMRFDRYKGTKPGSQSGNIAKKLYHGHPFTFVVAFAKVTG